MIGLIFNNKVSIQIHKLKILQYNTKFSKLLAIKFFYYTSTEHFNFAFNPNLANSGVFLCQLLNIPTK